MNEIKVFEERELLGQNFRIYGSVEDPLFMAKDVANWIEHSDVSMMLQKIDKTEKLTQTMFVSGQRRSIWFITEDGLYEVLMQSRKPIAKQFKTQVKAILKELRLKGYVALKSSANVKAQLAEARQRNAKVREASLYLKLADRAKVETYKEILYAKSAEVLSGEQLLPLPAAHKRTYSAKEIGDMLGISANRVGHLTNAHGLKTEEFGEWVWDKSQYSAHECRTFRYYIEIVARLKQLMKEVA